MRRGRGMQAARYDWRARTCWQAKFPRGMPAWCTDEHWCLRSETARKVRGQGSIRWRQACVKTGEANVECSLGPAHALEAAACVAGGPRNPLINQGRPPANLNSGVGMAAMPRGGLKGGGSLIL